MQMSGACDCATTPPLHDASVAVSKVVSAMSIKLGLVAGASQVVGRYFGTIELRQRCESGEQNPFGHSLSFMQPRHAFVAVSQTWSPHVLESTHSTQTSFGPHTASGAEHDVESRHSTQLPSGAQNGVGDMQSDALWHVVGTTHPFWTQFSPSGQFEPTGRPIASQSACVVQHASGFRLVGR
jgi:hypothetical protein